MKSKVLTFAAGVAITLCLASTQEFRSIMQTKPVQPKKVKVGLFDYSYEVKDYINANTKYGYHVQSMSGAGDRYGMEFIVVMYKY